MNAQREVSAVNPSVSESVEAEVRLPFARAKLFHCFVETPYEYIAVPSQHLLRMGFHPAKPSELLRFSDSQRAEFRPIGSMWFIPAGQLVQAKGQGGVRRWIECEFDPQTFSQWLQHDSAWNPASLSGHLNMESNVIRQLVARLKSEMTVGGLSSQFMCELLIAQIGIEIGRLSWSGDDDVARGGLAPWRLKKIQERVLDSEKPPSLSELSEACGLSVRQITRGFRASCGVSIGEFVNETRLNRAKALLVEGRSLKEIADRLGFSTPGNFATSFRRAIGETPREFRAGLSKNKLS